VKEEDKVFIGHILESIDLIQSYTERLIKEEFFSLPQVQDAVIRRLEIIGEAVKNLSSEVKQKRPDVPWRQIAGMRDVLIHEYFGVDLEKDLPLLKQELLCLLKET